MHALRTAVALAAAAALTGCGSSSSPAPATPTPTSAAPSASPTMPASPTASTPTSTPTSTTIRTPSHPATPTPSAITAPLVIYYIAVGDNGRGGRAVGCGDSAIATYTAPIRYRNAVGAAITALLRNRSREIGQSGLINVLYRSTLTYRSSVIRGTTVVVYLSGSFQLAGVCDIPRAKAELEYTALRAAHATRVVIYVDGQTIDQRLSLK